MSQPSGPPPDRSISESDGAVTPESVRASRLSDGQRAALKSAATTLSGQVRKHIKMDTHLMKELELLYDQAVCALGDPKRLIILYALREKSCYVGELVVELGMSQSTVSRHLRILREHELVKTTRSSNAISHSLLHEILNLKSKSDANPKRHVCTLQVWRRSQSQCRNAVNTLREIPSGISISDANESQISESLQAYVG